MTGEIQVYGTDWCGLTYRVREYLMNARLPYEYFDIERDLDAQDIVMSLAEGRRTFPLVIVEGRVIVDPMSGGLQRVLEELDEHDIRPRRRVRRPTDQRP